jgi:hypothetical protein
LDLLSGLRAGAAIDTPPLSASSSGAFRWRELLSGVGGTDRVTVLGR